MAMNDEIDDSIRPLLRLSRETIERCQKAEYALVSSLERDPLLKERVRRLRTVPGVGPITALSWALEMGDISRFRSPSGRFALSLWDGRTICSVDQTEVRVPLPSTPYWERHASTVSIPSAGCARC
jgi:Transposase IS116/IS110/IS902 family